MIRRRRGKRYVTRWSKRENKYCADFFLNQNDTFFYTIYFLLLYFGYVKLTVNFDCWKN